MLGFVLSLGLTATHYSQSSHPFSPKPPPRKKRSNESLRVNTNFFCSYLMIKKMRISHKDGAMKGIQKIFFK